MSYNQYVYCPFCARTLSFKLEEERLRKFCRECKWTHYPTPHLASAAVIKRLNQNMELQVLMVKRKREPFAGTWMFPAGFLEWGEHPEKDTLVREVGEEVGLKIISSHFMRILKAESDPRSPEHLVIFYDTHAIGEIISNDSDENSDVKWITIMEKVDIGFPHHRAIFNELRNRYLLETEEP